MADREPNDRQRLVVELLSSAGRQVSRLAFMKWLFLLVRETDWGGRECPYDFVPYRFGPFSFRAYEDIRKLGALGVVEQSGDALRLVSSRVPGLPPARSAVEDVLRRYQSLSLDALMTHVYTAYPWYAMLSEWSGAPGTPVKRKLAEPAAFTIGYAGRNVDEFLSILLEAEVVGVMDVRNTPQSRAYGFSRSHLERNLPRLGLEYVSCRELGIPAVDRRSSARDDRASLLAAYQRRVLREQGEALADLQARARQRPLALMCMESDPRDCHRSVLAGILADATGLEVVHL